MTKLENSKLSVWPDTSPSLNKEEVQYINYIKKWIDTVLSDREDNVGTSDLKNELHRTKMLVRFDLLKHDDKDRVYHHTIRMINFIIENNEVISKFLNIEYLYFIVLIHDLPENITKDIPSNIKKHLDKETLDKIKLIEKLYYKELFKKIDTWDIKEDEVINDLQNKESEDYNFMKFIDTLDWVLYYYFYIYPNNKNKKPFKKYVDELYKYIDNFQNILNEKALKWTLLDIGFLKNFIIDIESIINNTDSSANQNHIEQLKEAFESINKEKYPLNYYAKEVEPTRYI